MPARSIPESPTFVTASEERVWRRACESLPGGSLVLPNLRLTDEQKDHEADLVALIPDAGVLVLEVKGGSLWHDDEGWWISRARGPERCWPVDQARDAKHALRRYVEQDPRWGSRGRVAWSHGVVAPASRFGHEFAVPELPRWALHDLEELALLGERLPQNAWGLAHGCRIPTLDDVELVAEILAGRAHTAFDPNADAEARADEADRLTQEQAAVLQVTRLLRRVEIRGGAGSGKTVLALQKAKDLSRGGGGRPAERVALLCYSVGLAEYLKRVVAGWPRRHRPAFVGTYEELGRLWGLEMARDDDSDFWESRLPALMAEQAAHLPDGRRFDAVVVDEAQDFAESWWAPLLGALRDERDGGLFVFADENQRLFARFGRPPVQLVPLVLDHNLRNTRQIHDAFGPLAPSRMQARGGEGPAVRFVAAGPGPDAVLEAADDAVEQLLEEGWEPGRVALLTTGHRHPEQTAQVERHGKVGYWRSFWEGEDVFYGHVLGSKGLERACVVLCLNEPEPRDRARERLYVGMSRATDVLVVVGEPAIVAAAGGPEVARRLGLSAEESR
ncbi:NERD domain-containing protein [Nocardioides sp. TRM66260-LWL]|uniref:nuclease-related domain-containing DEAD/DEAH box helicase n=1 Tax=Nocardioides sp. TRM66260-LWL TaxID=2874478 RepID=UPI001CC71963|nr:NERD domain-containing protein [Nocardioides sp. TRM66260-LWL]MBZ5735041.1 NERD domain-containing protein [Nocardioides sp. TRM66260-LWL]